MYRQHRNCTENDWTYTTYKIGVDSVCHLIVDENSSEMKVPVLIDQKCLWKGTENTQIQSFSVQMWRWQHLCKRPLTSIIGNETWTTGLQAIFFFRISACPWHQEIDLPFDCCGASIIFFAYRATYSKCLLRLSYCKYTPPPSLITPAANPSSFKMFTTARKQHCGRCRIPWQLLLLVALLPTFQ